MRALALILSMLVVCATTSGANAQSAKSSLTDPAEADMFNRVSDRLVCQCGCNMILRVCNHFECPSAIPMRKSIEQQIRAGVDEETIVAGFVEEYGAVVLSTPPAEGLNLAAWVMPGFAILIGGFLVAYLVADWRSKKRARPSPTITALDPGVASRIEDELRSMDS